MGLFDWLRKKQGAAADAATGAPAPHPAGRGTQAHSRTEASSPAADRARSRAELRADPELVEVVDEQGRETFIDRAAWRGKILPATLKAKWDNAEALDATIHAALEEELYEEVVHASARLVEIHPDRPRATALHALALSKSGRLDGAEHTLTTYLDVHGQDPSILTALARVKAERGEPEAAEELLWKALQGDPNHYETLLWYAAAGARQDGDRGRVAAFERVTRLPGSWRAHAWIARNALAEGALERARELYATALARAGEPAPTDLLLQTSGDLGERGHLRELLEVAAPRFRPETHGLAVGNNLIKANVELGRLDAAAALVAELGACERREWQRALRSWEDEIARRRERAEAPAERERLESTMLLLPGPVWLGDDGPLVGSEPPKSGPTVAFLGSSATLLEPADSDQASTREAAGGISRAIPLLLTEYLHFTSTAETYSLVPWIRSESGGFMLVGDAWSDASACEYARRGETPADLVVATHLLVGEGSWRLMVRCLRSVDSAVMSVFELDFPPRAPSAMISTLIENLRRVLLTEAGVETRPAPDGYRIPASSRLDHYLLRLDQCLAVRCAALEPRNPDFLSDPAEILEGMIRLTLEYSTSPSCRSLLAYTLLRLRELRPELVSSLRERVSKLHADEPLAPPVQAALTRCFRKAFAD